jgi:hypothetical protein
MARGSQKELMLASQESTRTPKNNLISIDLKIVNQVLILNGVKRSI